jgi:hypothetical protein
LGGHRQLPIRCPPPPDPGALPGRHPDRLQLRPRRQPHPEGRDRGGEYHTDGDGISDSKDNCPADSNPDQADLDSDGLGNACDPDIDGDGVPNAGDAFPLDPSESLDTDADGIGNNAGPDDDNDGVLDQYDVDPLDPAVGSVLLNLAKTDASDPVQAGSQLTYTVDYSNDGSSKLAATGLMLTETYGSRATFALANPMPDQGDNVWHLSDLAPGASGTITVTVNIPSPLPNMAPSSSTRSPSAATRARPPPPRQQGWKATRC